MRPSSSPRRSRSASKRLLKVTFAHLRMAFASWPSPVRDPVRVRRPPETGCRAEKARRRRRQIRPHQAGASVVYLVLSRIWEDQEVDLRPGRVDDNRRQMTTYKRMPRIGLNDRSCIAACRGRARLYFPTTGIGRTRPSSGPTPTSGFEIRPRPDQRVSRRRAIRTSTSRCAPMAMGSKRAFGHWSVRSPMARPPPTESWLAGWEPTTPKEVGAAVGRNPTCLLVPVPPRRGHGRQADRLCRRSRAQAISPRPRGRSHRTAESALLRWVLTFPTARAST